MQSTSLDTIRSSKSIISQATKGLSELSESTSGSSRKLKRLKQNTKLLYSAAILNEITKNDKSLGQKFIARLKVNLSAKNQTRLGPVKTVAHKALKDLVREGALSLAEMKKITKAAWKFVLGLADKTRFVNSKSTAARSSSLAVASRLATAPAGFLWKPVSDSPPHGLAILLPPSWTGQIERLDIIDPASGDILASGKDVGIGNGDRQHFRFAQQGGDFPEGAIVRVRFKDGSVQEISVGNTASRMEGR